MVKSNGATVRAIPYKVFNNIIYTSGTKINIAISYKTQDHVRMTISTRIYSNVVDALLNKETLGL